ncbi:bifunctional diaminohydroxyphosphoribosylaminopyrimidine deaminase/5-amino-6-(5-phosphoribosylamino)uracil reductase RibD [Clostridium rectalis]|uniref:bifunctional diaminohydroxyphosphoribosylaminopyrimidine deaminase/5-amino-6-(5-phosphoribosylamino)uracil reductase RibD n=1 Tax=Clostridium rectalis TaxID=2040295 RepID=UPI003C12B889
MHENYMRRCIKLAQNGIGKVNPNPLVGALIVKDGQVLGEGYHEYFGGNHAEINAFKNCNTSVEKATLYVTLEPCSHYGKTPPCVDVIIEKGIKKVVIGMMDPNPLVSGSGIKILKNNGIEVITGIMEKEVKKLNEVFIKYIKEKLPFCMIKTAMTLDGKIATYKGDSKWITNEKSRAFVHEIRNKYSAIMVGIGTVIKDNPSLTTRLKGNNLRNPIRIIVDSNGRIPLNSRILQEEGKNIVVLTENAHSEKINMLKEKGVDIVITPNKHGKVDLTSLMRILGARGIDSVLIEGGGTLNYSCLKENIVDKINIFIAPKIIGGKEAKTPVEGEGIEGIKDSINLINVNIIKFDEDILIEADLNYGN